MALRRSFKAGVVAVAAALAMAGATTGNAMASTGATQSAGPVTVTGTATNEVYASQDKKAWTYSFQASRPLASWQLVVRRTSTGQLVHRYTGGPVATSGTASWDGSTDAGLLAFDGMYTWQFLATPADAAAGAAPTLAASGTLTVLFGRMAFHSYTLDGSPILLGILARPAMYEPAGAGLFYRGYAQGLLTGPFIGLSTHRWNLGSGPNQVKDVIAFGDFNSDTGNDYMARTGAGVLEYWADPWPGTASNYGTPKVISSGWNNYTSLIAVGDVNRDNHDDLLARDKTGRLWLYRGTGKGGFGGRVALGGGWNAYTHIVGIGDINGDGNGDLLAVDAAGGVWRYLGNGKGSFGTRVKIGSGFPSYNTVLGMGEMIAGSPNSVLARDAAGALWRYDFTATGTLKPRVLIPGQWNVFAGLY